MFGRLAKVVPEIFEVGSVYGGGIVIVESVLV